MGEANDSNFTIHFPTIPDYNISITDFGGKGNGHTSNTQSFVKAVGAIHHNGGGRLIIPKGIWLTGPIRFTSHMELHLQKGAVIRFSGDYSDYPLIVSSFEGEPSVRCQSPLDGEDVTNIAITGEGVIDGAGEAWRPVKKYKVTSEQWNQLVDSGGVVEEYDDIWWPTKAALAGKQAVKNLKGSQEFSLSTYEPYKEFLRPNLVSFRRCNIILITGVTFQNSPAWNIHPYMCSHVTIKGIYVKNPWYSQNGDGLDVESCRYVSVEDSVFDVGDDAICVKSGKDEAGRKAAMPSEDIQIKGCTVYHGHGGFVIGSEMSGDVRRVSVTNCLFMGTDTGLRFKSCRGRGGIVEAISISDIHMVNIKHEAVIFHMFYEKAEEEEMCWKPFSEKTPQFRRIHMNRLMCSGAEQAISMKGLPEMPLQDIAFTHSEFYTKYGITALYCDQLSLINTRVTTTNNPKLSLNHVTNHNLKEEDIFTETHLL
ncbi:glycoside hydrolase family 28 protein [Bacillus sp. A301a_S52]|jgi:polygalacturonase|nr:glycoside hydrolase family 28 protein [Bacillus sp. A301a_S52]